MKQHRYHARWHQYHYENGNMLYANHSHHFSAPEWVKPRGAEEKPGGGKKAEITGNDGTSSYMINDHIWCL